MPNPYRISPRDPLEPQKYPMKPAAPGQVPERPYDVTGWTLPMQMGVDALEIKKPFDAKLERVTPIPFPAGGIATGTARGISKAAPENAPDAKRSPAYTLSHDENNSAIAVNRLLAKSTSSNAPYDVYWTAETQIAGSQEIPAGTILVVPKSGAAIDSILNQTGHDSHVAFS